MIQKTYDVDITLHDESTIKADGDALQMFNAETITKLEKDGTTTYVPYHAIVKETFTVTETEVEVTDTSCIENGK